MVEQKRRILVANWKMNYGPLNSGRIAAEFKAALNHLKRTDVWVAPGAESLSVVSNALKGSDILVGSQNIGWVEKGAFTGELSVSSARECGATFAIVGHSERRHLCGESNELVGLKAAFSLSQRLVTVFCVGETLAERSANSTSLVLKRQLSVLTSEHRHLWSEYLIVAYEPVWAIGTGKVASPADITGAVRVIQEVLSNGPAVKLIYGGSVTGANLSEILCVDGVCGALVGGASLSLQTFEPLVRCAESLT